MTDSAKQLYVLYNINMKIQFNNLYIKILIYHMIRCLLVALIFYLLYFIFSYNSTNNSYGAIAMLFISAYIFPFVILVIFPILNFILLGKSIANITKIFIISLILILINIIIDIIFVPLLFLNIFPNDGLIGITLIFTLLDIVQFIICIIIQRFRFKRPILTK